MSSKAKRLISVVLASALSCVIFAQGKLTGVEWKKVGEGIELQIQGTDLKKPKTIWTNKNRSYMLEFNASLVGKSGMKRINSAGVKYVTYGWFQARPPKVRVHVYMDPGTKPELAINTNSNWLVSVGNTELVAKKGDFPDEVPPLDTVYAPSSKQFSTDNQGKPGQPGQPGTLTNVIEKMAASPVKALPSTHNVHPLRRKVSLTFESTEIVQILKALALQADVNIVTAPNVTGKLSVSLTDVDVQQALDFVTTLAGVRYALVGNTFVVATNENFAATMRQIENGPEVNSQTRIVGLQSGEGAQIKATVLKAVPQESLLGRYDILLPTEITTLETKSSQSTATGGNTPGTATAGDTEKTDITSRATTGGPNARQKDMYLVLVGMPKRLDEIEKVVRDVDSRIADAGRVVIGKDIDTRVIPIYSGRTSEVSSAVRRVVDRDPKKELYDIQESSSGGPNETDSIRLLMISGPNESLSNIEGFAKGIDEGLCKSMGIEYPETQEDQARAFEIVELMYVEPIEAAAELQKQVPGLRATLLPGGVRPNVRGTKSVVLGDADSGNSTETNVDNSGKGLGVKGGTGSAGPSANGGTSGSAGNSLSSGAGSSQTDGVSLTRSLGHEPMKLMLRGTRAQITSARSFLTAFDVAPKMVALELRVMEMSREDALKVGLDWSAVTGGAVQFIRMNQGINSSDSIPGTIGADLRFDGRSGASVTATLDKLAGSFKMVARPNILASEGRPTFIFVGDEVRYVESIQASQNGTTVTTGQVNVGVKLNVTPRIGAGGNITLDLNPEMSVLKGFLDVPGGGQLPQTSLRSTTNMLQVRSGETIAIGGLIQESDRKSVSGVPILMDLPIIGHLFKRTNNTKTTSEVVFFLTVTEVGPNNRATAADPRSGRN